MHAVSSVVSDSLRHHGLGSSVYEILQARRLEWVAISSPGDLPNPGIEFMSLISPELAGGFLTTSTNWEAQVR